jgi:hypothetical protein
MQGRRESESDQDGGGHHRTSGAVLIGLGAFFLALGAFLRWWGGLELGFITPDAMMVIAMVQVTVGVVLRTTTSD